MFQQEKAKQMKVGGHPLKGTPPLQKGLPGPARTEAATKAKADQMFPGVAEKAAKHLSPGAAARTTRAHQNGPAEAAEKAAVAIKTAVARRIAGIAVHPAGNYPLHNVDNILHYIQTI